VRIAALVQGFLFVDRVDTMSGVPAHESGCSEGVGIRGACRWAGHHHCFGEGLDDPAAFIEQTVRTRVVGFGVPRLSDPNGNRATVLGPAACSAAWAASFGRSPRLGVDGPPATSFSGGWVSAGLMVALWFCRRVIDP